MNETTQSEAQKLMFEAIRGKKNDISKRSEPIQRNYDTETINRIIELEAKVGKLWDLLTEKTPYGKEKPSPMGKKFGLLLKR